ncbi:hypothetical protein ALC60_07673, partial [Trachymyrmex zeteki]
AFALRPRKSDKEPASEFRLFDVQTRTERIFALLVFMFVSILVEHCNLGSQRFLQRQGDKLIINSLLLY